MHDPVLVLGMHRSGTGLVARTLTRLGVFMGAHLDPNHEALAFLELNRFALREAGARWDQPEPVSAMLDTPEVRVLFRAHLQQMVRSPYMRWYTGSRLRRSSLLDGLGRWGWKDPRTVLLLPIWLEVFPNARLIHVRRHGVDVAASLRARHRKTLAEAVQELEQDELFSWKEPYRPFIDTVRAGTLEGAFELWEHYLSVAESHLAGKQVLELSYEQFLARPADAVGRIAEFLTIDPPPGAVDDIAALSDGSRAFAYRRDPELVTFAAGVADRLRRHGYEPASQQDAEA